MDRVSAGDTTSAEAQARRDRLREQARERRHRAPPDLGRGAPAETRHRASERFRTPEWLDRSFVLPLARPEVTVLPSQPTPHHDRAAYLSPHERLRRVAAPSAGPAAVAAPVFVRPPTREIDFARVVRRADVRRAATRTALTTAGLAAVLLMAYLLTAGTGALAASILFGVAALVALGVRVRVGTAPIPHLER